MDTEVNKYFYTEDALNALEVSLSPNKIATYTSETKRDRRLALQLYTWNTAVSAAFCGKVTSKKWRNSAISLLKTPSGFIKVLVKRAKRAEKTHQIHSQMPSKKPSHIKFHLKKQLVMPDGL